MSANLFDRRTVRLFRKEDGLPIPPDAKD
jgi:hypothetical protein